MSTATSQTKKISEYLKYEFSAAETADNAQRLARTNRSAVEQELKKKQLSADLKTEEETLKADIARLSRYVTDGYDFRVIECEVHYHQPSNGQKEIVRTDTGEVVNVLRMTPEELQDRLFEEEE